MITGVAILVLCITTRTSSHRVEVTQTPLWLIKMCLERTTLTPCLETPVREPPRSSPTKSYLNLTTTKMRYKKDDLLNNNLFRANPEIHAGQIHFLKNLTHERISEKSDFKTITKKNDIKPKINKLGKETNGRPTVSVNVSVVLINRATHDAPGSEIGLKDKERNHSLVQEFANSLEQFDRLFYITTFDKLVAKNAVLKHDNGISFVQSGLFLQLALIALSTEVDGETKREIDQQLRFNATDAEKMETINEIITSLPKSDNDTKFHWGTRLMLMSNKNVSQQFWNGSAAKLCLKIDHFNGTKTPYEMTDILNNLVESDSKGVLRNTFDEDDLSSNVEAVLITTMYLRARWRSAPTLLNGTHLFHSSLTDPPQTVRMIRINDIMKYASLPDWNAQAIEIYYFHPDLSLLMIVPHGRSLKDLAKEVSNTDVRRITEKMRRIRIAATLPLFTLRMTLLLPNKLRNMGLSRLVSRDNATHTLQISHAVQRLMFWTEAGRYAFKDDGLEWDEPPEREVLVDRPYIFYVRWKNMTLMSGNFVL